MWAAPVWPPHFSPASQGSPWPLPALGRGTGSAQVPHRLHHDHPAAPGEGVWVGGQQLVVGGHPVGWLVLSPPSPAPAGTISKDVSLLSLPRPRGSGWPSTRCGNTARMKRWWPRPKSSSRTGSGCWVSDAGERQEPPSPPPKPQPSQAIPAPQNPDGGQGWDQSRAGPCRFPCYAAAVTQSCLMDFPRAHFCSGMERCKPV